MISEIKIDMSFPAHQFIIQAFSASFRLDRVNVAVFNLTTHDSYFTVLVEVFTNHILAENTYFTNQSEQNTSL